MSPQDGENLDEQQKENQKALGNTDLQDTINDSDETAREPQITGTGSNNAAATPESLIVHEQEEGENRYENRKSESD